jgi:glycosyltransferase involved in cell wall biosynthesis
VIVKRVLLIIESCNPDWASVPLVGYNFYKVISDIADVTLVTHSRNKSALLKRHPVSKIHFVEPGFWEGFYYKVVAILSTYKGRVVWPLRHALLFPLYFFFDRAVYRALKIKVESGEFDIVHALTPMMPRYPVSIIRGCRNVPFVLGPVNGGVPFPEAFRALGRKEFAYLNFLRAFGARLIPNYRHTYMQADMVLAGSTYTRSWIIREFGRDQAITKLVYENAVPEEFYNTRVPKKESSPLRLLFVGRLVPYKGADMLIKALASPELVNHDFVLDIVGNGPELSHLQSLVESLNLLAKVNFVGWLEQHKIADYYKRSDVFCFPSVREFGGAVVMEAMASGLPCVVVDNGGIGEYVTNETGYKIAPRGESFVIEGIRNAVLELIKNPMLLQEKSASAFSRAREFSWRRKGEIINEVYNDLLSGYESRLG